MTISKYDCTKQSSLNILNFSILAPRMHRMAMRSPI